MNTIKVAFAGAAVLFMNTGMSFADASMYGAVSVGDANYEAALAEQDIVIGAAIYGAYDADYDAVLTAPDFFAKAALGQHDAGYEVILAERGQPVGTMLYGQGEADYGSYLIEDDFFATAALGDYDADYEPVLAARAPMGSAYFANSGIDFAALLN